MATANTLNSKYSDARLCRINGWKPGQLLVGDEGYGPTVIKITAIGEQAVLAMSITHNGKRTMDIEMCWTLKNRDWKPYKSGKR